MERIEYDSPSNPPSSSSPLVGCTWLDRCFPSLENEAISLPTRAIECVEMSRKRKGSKEGSSRRFMSENCRDGKALILA